VQLLECVPNFSEGRDLKVLLEIENAIQSISGIKLLHKDVGFDANRTVFTFIGIPEAVIEAAYEAINVAAQCIDMRKHKGAHPRIGATDVCPLIPYANISVEEANMYAHQLAKNVGEVLGIPVYCYEESRLKDERKSLEYIRKGEYEALGKKIKQKEWKPDYGSTINFPQTGATVIGVRNFLIAYNINLATRNVEIAKKIASQIRTSGFSTTNESGTKINTSGYFQHCKAIGWDMPEYDCTQISTNLTNFKVTNMQQVYEKVKELASENNVNINGSELIGLVPLEAIISAGKYYSSSNIETEIIDAAIENLGLHSVVPFEKNKRIIEYLL